MPKEVVYGEMLSETELGEKPIVEVGWNREGGYVQIVSKVISVIGGRLAEDEGIHYTDGIFVNLDRRGINALIRNLRRARDQAYGRDE